VRCLSLGKDGGGSERVPGDLYAAPGRSDPRGQEAGAPSLTRRRRQGQEDRRQNQGRVVNGIISCTNPTVRIIISDPETKPL
jgi:hypothetical protein